MSNLEKKQQLKLELEVIKQKLKRMEELYRKRFMTKAEYQEYLQLEKELDEVPYSLRCRA